MQHSAAQYSKAQHSAAQQSTAQHSAAQHSTAQHSAAQGSTAQHSSAQHSSAPHEYLVYDPGHTCHLYIHINAAQYIKNLTIYYRILFNMKSSIV